MLIGRKLILYGAGQRGRTLCRILNYLHISNFMIVDSNIELIGSEIEGHYVEEPEKIREFSDCILCITIANKKEKYCVQEKLINEYGYCYKQIVTYEKVILDAYTSSKVFFQQILGMESNIVDGKEAVLFDCYNGLGFGGVEAWTMDLCCARIKDGDSNVYIITDKGDYEVPYELEEHILRAYIDHNIHFSKNTVLDLIRIIMSKMPCKVITCAVNEVLLAAYFVKKIYPDMVKVISVIHNSNEDVYEGYIEFKECTDIYVGVSQDIKRDMIVRGICPAKIYSMTSPFVCDKLLCREYTESKVMPICIGYAGRMEYIQKRMDLFMKLMMRLKEKQVDFIIEFAGDGIARCEMEAFVVSNKLEENTKFWGTLKRSKITDFWRRQDVCINLSDYEGRSISILEGMANGAVPIVTKTSGVREDITDGVNGFMIPLDNYCMAADRIEYLSRHRENLRKMGMLAHDAVYPKSSMGSHLRFWEKVIGH